MRIIAGKAKGKTLRTVKGLRTRPTSDRVKETLFNILGDRVPGARFLDLFAGSGDVGIEALSRGAERAVLVEVSRSAARVICENLAACGMVAGYEVLCRDVASALRHLEQRGEQFDLVFLDPPYKSTLAAETLDIISRSALLGGDGMVVAEHHHKTVLEEKYRNLVCLRQRTIGETTLSFYAFAPLWR